MRYRFFHFVVLILVIVACRQGTETVKQEEKQSNYITFYSGDVSLRGQDRTQREVEIKGEILNGDAVQTGDQSLLTVQIETGLIKISENTAFTFSIVEDENRKSWQSTLENGSIFSKLQKLSKDNEYILKTPTSVIAVRGTEFLVSYDKETETTTVSVGEGVVEITNINTGEILNLESGKTAEITKELIKVVESSRITKLFLKMLGLEEMLEDPSVHETAFFFSQNRAKYEKEETYYKNKIELLKLYEDVPGFINFAEKRRIEKQIEEFTLESTNFEEIRNRLMLYQKMKSMSSLNRLRALGNGRIQRFSLVDGSQLVGVIISQNAESMYLDTGAGVIKLPKNDVVQRFDVE